jgi:polyisoprenoid-binding protein YceI
MLRKLLAAGVIGTGLVAPLWAASETFDLDSLHTFPSFEVNHLGFSVMRGTFTSTSGTLTFDEAQKTGSVKATIDAKSVWTGYDKRDEHLRSKDFFNVEKFPTLTFEADSFKLEADKPVTVNGNLTMLGVTKPVGLTVQLTKCGNRMDHQYDCGAIVSTAIKRADWGMNGFEPFIGDDIKISIEVEALKKK